MNKSELKRIAENLIETFNVAGKESIDLYSQGLKIQIKKDNSPVSNGDLKVDSIISEKIRELTPNIPIVSEETVDLAVKNKSNIFWLIDPIDGTNDYINNKDEFTINAALILNKTPVIGIINAPAKNRIFYSYGYKNSYEKTTRGEINLETIIKKNIKVIAVSYSNILKPEILNLHKKFKVSNYQKMKSSYKFCVIAAGEYDLYVAEARACEWDIAAGHAIVQNAGGIITDFNGNEILYGKENFKNPSLILKRSNDL